MTDGRPEPSKPPENDEQQTGSAQVPGTAGGGSRRTLLVILAACLCVIAAGVSIAVLSGPGGNQAGHTAGASSSPAPGKTAAAQPPAPIASSRATTGPEVTGNGIAKSALRWPPSLNRQVLRWEAGPGGKTLAAVEQQMGTAMQSAGLKLYVPMRQACIGLASDITTAQAGPPIPVRSMQRLYAQGLAGLSRAAADCRAAISTHASGDENVSVHVNAPVLNRSRVEFAAMSKKLYRATARIQSIHP
jgi:hypothetical protein